MVKITKVSTSNSKNDISKLMTGMSLGDRVLASYILSVDGHRVKPTKPKKSKKNAKKKVTKKSTVKK